MNNTTQEAFESKLDADPSDHEARAVYADWLEENATHENEMIYAAGLRWLAEKKKWPKHVLDVSEWHWWFENGESNYSTHELPIQVGNGRAWYRGHRTRRQAEYWAAVDLWRYGVTRVVGLVPHEEGSFAPL